MSRPNPTSEIEAVESLIGLGMWKAGDLIDQDADHDDVKQQLSIAIIKAYRKYDPSESSFSNYAYWWIRSELGHLRKNRRRKPRPRQAVFTENIPDHRDERPDPDLLANMERAVSRLRPRYQAIIRVWFGIGCEPAQTREEAAMRVGLQPRIFSEMKRQALILLREMLQGKDL